MRVANFTTNSTEIALADGTIILFSRSQPVAALVPGRGWLRTDSPADGVATKQANLWFSKHKGDDAVVHEVDQWELDQMVAF